MTAVFSVLVTHMIAIYSIKVAYMTIFYTGYIHDIPGFLHSLCAVRTAAYWIRWCLRDLCV